MVPVQKTARLAGFLYLLLVPLGLFGLNTYSVPAGPEDAARLANDIMSSESLYRLSIFFALLTPMVNLFLVLVLYKLLSPVNRDVAALMVIFIVVVTPIAMLNELNRYAALILLGGGSYLASFSTQQLQALAPVFLQMNQYGIAIAGIFWGLWLLPLGYLVYSSTFLPRLIGILLIVAGFGYVIDSFAKFLISGYSANIAIFTFWGELFFLLWLLIKGVNVERWEKRVA